MTIRKTRNLSRVPSPEVYSSISGAFHIAHAEKTEARGAEAVSRLGGVKVDWFSSESIGRRVAIQDARLGNNTRGPIQRSGP